MTKKALGRGLEALISATPRLEGDTVEDIEIEKIRPNRYQPRQRFDDSSLSELADSIRAKGIIQPVIVRIAGDNSYELIAGERRWRAAKMAGLSTVPAVVKSVSDAESLEMALIENLQRENLNPIEAAEAYSRLIEEFGLTREEISRRVGKDRSTVTNYLRLLTLPDVIKEHIAESRLSVGHAKAILSVAGREDQISFAEQLVKRGASVREAEALSRDQNKKRPKKSTKPRASFLREIEERLQRSLGTKVRIHPEKQGGKIIVEYYSNEDLHRIMDVIG